MPRRLIHWLCCVIFIGIASLVAPHARAAEEAAAAEKKPTVVKIGVYFTQLFDFDMPKRAFNATFWVWAEHKDPKFKPMENIELVNSKSQSSRFYSKQSINDYFWENMKYYGTIIKEWDSTNFPFDTQKLSVVLEDGVADASDVVYEADLKNSGHDETMNVLGWEIKNFEISAHNHLYDTNFGDRRVEEGSSYSRVEASIYVQRYGWRILFSTFIGFFVAFFLSMLTHYLNFGSLAASRVALSSGAVFAATGNKYIVDNILPPAKSFSLSDTIQAMTFLSIILSIITIIVMQVYYKSDQKRAEQLNKLMAAVSFTCFIGGVGWALGRAVL